MKKLEIKVTVFTFEHRGHIFRIDVFEDKPHGYQEAWIYTQTMGVKSLMFGNAYMSAAEFLKIVEANAEEHADAYINEYELEAE